MSGLPQHSSKSQEHYTPRDIVQVVHEIFQGPPDLDPASCAEANEVVGAHKYYTVEDDGLRQRWRGRVFMNPPYGLMEFKPRWSHARKAGRGYSSKEVWVEKLLLEFRRNVSEAIVLVTASTGDYWFHRVVWPYANAVCFPRRVKYQKPGGGLQSNQPGSSVLCYFGPWASEFTYHADILGPVVQRNITWERRVI